MRAGGGQAKGSSFERKTCEALSMWVTDGRQRDLFSRNIMSGGRFTIRVKAGDKEQGTPGDIRANDPNAYQFLSHFLVECKHYASLGIERFIFEPGDKSVLSEIIKKARKEADHAGVNMMLVLKQNRIEEVIMLDEAAASPALNSVPRRLWPLPHHILRLPDKPIYLFNMRRFLNAIRCADYLSNLENKQAGSHVVDR